MINEEATLSDVDIALLFDKDSEEMRKLEFLIWKNLTDILHTDEIDLFVMNKLPLSMQFEIIFSGQIICNNDNNKRTDYEVLTCAQYWDFKKLEDEYNRYSLKRLKEKYLEGNIHDA
ncbi:MAG: nucleotidyltransferase domain-containing protein [candidate division KSB1 bacterium]|nr:nucleotidyltransferase domain-containing protein [candidate division KSB1 bacterium]